MKKLIIVLAILASLTVSSVQLQAHSNSPAEKTENARLAKKAEGTYTVTVTDGVNWFLYVYLIDTNELIEIIPLGN